MEYVMCVQQRRRDDAIFSPSNGWPPPCHLLLFSSLLIEAPVVVWRWLLV